MTDIIIAGFGGQGVLTAGKILITVAAKKDKEVTWTSTYGAEMRGGTASCSVVISDEEIGNPYPSKVDVLVVLNEPSLTKYQGFVRDGGIIIVNSSLEKNINKKEGINYYSIDATDISNELNYSRGENIVMLGTMLKATNILDHDYFKEELQNYFEARSLYRNEILQCFEIGYSKIKNL